MPRKTRRSNKSGTHIKNKIIDKLLSKKYKLFDYQIKEVIRHLESSEFNETTQHIFKENTQYYDVYFL